MPSAIRNLTWERLRDFRVRRRVRNTSALGLVMLGPVLAGATLLVFGSIDQGGSPETMRIVLLTDLVYILVLAALVMGRVARMFMAHRVRSAGSRLHLRLSGVFAVVALAPTVLVAVFASITLNLGLESWFSERVRSVLGSSLAAAQAYEEEHRRELESNARSLADYLNLARRTNFYVSDGQLRQLLTPDQPQVRRDLREGSDAAATGDQFYSFDFGRLSLSERERAGQGEAVIIQGILKEAFVIDSAAEIRARGEHSYLFDYEEPTPEQIERALRDDIVIIEDWDINEFRAIVKLNGYIDRFLYVSSSVDGEILNLLDDTKATFAIYTQLESERGRILFEFGLIYLGFALILILAVIWFGLRFAERLSRPIGQLASAAQRVGTGDLDVRVREESRDDEISMLGRDFNQMVGRLKEQHSAILETNIQIDRRRRLFDSVLGSVTAGVVGLDRNGAITFVNRSAERLLQLPRGAHEGLVADTVPEFGELFDRLRTGGAGSAHGQVKLTRNRKQEILLVRMATRNSEDGAPEGYVIAFDDVTDLVSAQRMAAWGDVARRIAHEIKNPLTPIQLSAERLKRKYTPLLEPEEAGPLAQLTEVIVRQTNDLRRIVDEFSKFARMPEPERRMEDLAELVRGAVLLQREARRNGIAVTSDLPEDSVMAEVDRTMIGQALTNLLKNAVEAIEAYREKVGSSDESGEVRAAMTCSGSGILITVSDNGIGLPADRAKLFEPYVTTRSGGTGLGLPIVRKIIEEHGGMLDLVDADPFGSGARRGARAEIWLPLPERESLSSPETSAQ